MDLVGPASGVEAVLPHALADRLARDAEAVDVSGVARSMIDDLAQAGLLGTVLPAAQQRELAESIAMADASTWFCWVQHQTPLRTLEGEGPAVVSPASDVLREELLPGLRNGSLLAAVAFAHVRRPGTPDPIATRIDGGWSFDGHLDWVTSWDIADVVMIMAQGSGPDAGMLVCAFLPAGHSPTSTNGVEPGPVLDLLAMGGTHTRPVNLDDVRVPDDRVVLLDREAWLAYDATKTVDVNPATFGIARGAIAELAQLAEQRSDEGMQSLARALAEKCILLRSAAYAAMDNDDDLSERLRLRAESLALMTDAALSVITARAGAAMQRGHSAERRLREAMFLQVQAQTATTRAASLNLLRARNTEGGESQERAFTFRGADSRVP